MNDDDARQIIKRQNEFNARYRRTPDEPVHAAGEFVEAAPAGWAAALDRVAELESQVRERDKELERERKWGPRSPGSGYMGLDRLADLFGGEPDSLDELCDAAVAQIESQRAVFGECVDALRKLADAMRDVLNHSSKQQFVTDPAVVKAVIAEQEARAALDRVQSDADLPH